MLASPYFLSLLAVLICFIALPTQTWKKRAVKFVGIGVILALSVFSTPAVTRMLAKSWETPLGDSKALAASGPYDAILILGGGIDVRNSAGEQLMLNDAAERFTAAATLYKAGIAPRILFSGGSGNLDKTIKEAPYAARLLEAIGVPKDAIILESESRNTFENAIYSKKAMENAEIKRVVLITSCWHMPRAAAIFKKANIEFAPYAVDTLAEYGDIPGDYLPDAGALDRSTRLIRERIGFIAYRALGRL
jgi:uncharacterized SAM-binding protein YcdF (DUF218 family)